MRVDIQILQPVFAPTAPTPTGSARPDLVLTTPVR